LPGTDPKPEVSLEHAKKERESRLIEAILALDAPFPQELVREEFGRRALRASLFLPFIYALLIVALTVVTIQASSYSVMESSSWQLA